jgi:glycosyltransferase involved in cell wall biosynthesis
MSAEISLPRIAVVIPCFRVSGRILDVIAGIGAEVGWIIVVDDACPERTGDVVETQCRDPRVQVIRHATNQGVGGAVLTGYAACRSLSAAAIVKLDGDGQMDPALIPRLVDPLLRSHADYVKGNRFYRLSHVATMPGTRLLGNAVLSFMVKLSSGYWQLFDPTNGFTAIRRELLLELDLHAIARRYFFESDMLHHLNQLRAVVEEVPMRAKYDGEPSSLRPLRMVWPFLRGNVRNTFRRVLYSYFIRGFSAASMELLIGLPMVLFGVAFGVAQWVGSTVHDQASTAGTVMLAALPIILGTQLVLSWLNFDVASEPRLPIHPRLEQRLFAKPNE